LNICYSNNLLQIYSYSNSVNNYLRIYSYSVENKKPNIFVFGQEFNIRPTLYIIVHHCSIMFHSPRLGQQNGSETNNHQTSVERYTSHRQTRE
jgi:hypothetical protein